MAPFATLPARPDFVKSYSKVRCRFCASPDVQPAKILNKSVNNFLESKAAFQCYELVVVPLSNYITEGVMASPQLIRFCLSNIHTISDLRKLGLVKEFLIHHLQLHPPCRPGMSEYYFSVLHQHLGSFMFEKQLISDIFFDFVRRLKDAISVWGAYVIAVGAPSTSSAATLSRKEVLDFLKQNCKSINQPDPDSIVPQMDLLMFVFKYSVDILIHDYESTRDTFATPLVVKVVWGPDFDSESEKPLTSHCQDIMWMYFKCQPHHRIHIARYLTLLAEVMQKGVGPSESYFWELRTNAIVDAFAQKFTENDQIPVDCIENIPSRKFQCQILQSLIYENILRGADYPKKCSLSRSNSRSKKYFSLFDKKSNKK